MDKSPKSINDLLDLAASPDTYTADPSDSDPDTPPPTPERRTHPDLDRVIADLDFFGAMFLEAAGKAMRERGGIRMVTIRKLSVAVPGEGDQEAAGIMLPVWFNELGSADNKVFFTGIGPEGGELATATVSEDADAEETLDATPLNLKGLDIDSLYRLERVMVTETLRLDPATRGFSANRPKRATLLQEDDGFYAATEDGRRYRVPMVSVRQNKLEAGSEVAALVPKSNPDQPWASVQPVGYYDAKVFEPEDEESA